MPRVEARRNLKRHFRDILSICPMPSFSGSSKNRVK